MARLSLLQRSVQLGPKSDRTSQSQSRHTSKHSSMQQGTQAAGQNTSSNMITLKRPPAVMPSHLQHPVLQCGIAASQAGCCPIVWPTMSIEQKVCLPAICTGCLY